MSSYEKHDSCVVAVASLDKGRVASVAFEKRIHVWDSTRDNALQMLLTGHKGQVTCLLYLGKGILASGSSDATVRLWDVGDEALEPSQRALGTLLGHTAVVKTIKKATILRLDLGCERKYDPRWTLIDSPRGVTTAQSASGTT